MYDLTTINPGATALIPEGTYHGFVHSITTYPAKEGKDFPYAIIGVTIDKSKHPGLPKYKMDYAAFVSADPNGYKIGDLHRAAGIAPAKYDSFEAVLAPVKNKDLMFEVVHQARRDGKGDQENVKKFVMNDNAHTAHIEAVLTNDVNSATIGMADMPQSPSMPEENKLF